MAALLIETGSTPSNNHENTRKLITIFRTAIIQQSLNDYIVRFLDQATDFMIEKGYETLLKQFQGIVMDLAEYLRTRNG